ncbi:hypothetical protein JG687_00010438 [Phytophthora cactorum]|uniref:Uncharacterized protein n=1 Tax=Phytophthora cactorum TaxID=29920 RepID=A0A8T1U900_9STRA|nr:hypothetical protein GQ600_18389 [Phytophthora cactorum]KAG6956722.1 hypothetical protein JG687_00010438 [Phytophthora cactorum]
MLQLMADFVYTPCISAFTDEGEAVPARYATKWYARTCQSRWASYFKLDILFGERQNVRSHSVLDSSVITRRSASAKDSSDQDGNVNDDPGQFRSLTPMTQSTLAPGPPDNLNAEKFTSQQLDDGVLFPA